LDKRHQPLVGKSGGEDVPSKNTRTIGQTELPNAAVKLPPEADHVTHSTPDVIADALFDRLADVHVEANSVVHHTYALCG